jgi:hypothetical protein
MRVLIVHNYYQQAGGEDSVVANERAMLESHGHKTHSGPSATMSSPVRGARSRQPRERHIPVLPAIRLPG